MWEDTPKLWAVLFPRQEPWQNKREKLNWAWPFTFSCFLTADTQYNMCPPFLPHCFFTSMVDWVLKPSFSSNVDCPLFTLGDMLSQQWEKLLTQERACAMWTPEALPPGHSLSPLCQNTVQLTRESLGLMLNSPSFTSSLSLSIWACNTYLLMSLFMIF